MTDSNGNISSESTISMYKSSSKGSVHSDQACVRFSDSKTREKDSEPKIVAINLVLLWTGKGHYRRYFYVRQVLKTVSKENCGRYFLRNTSRIVKKTLTLIMLVCKHGDYPFEELRFCIFYANEKQQKKTDRCYVRAKYRAPFWIFVIVRCIIHQL